MQALYYLLPVAELVLLERIIGSILVVIIALTLPPAVRAQDDATSEYKRKAAFLFNFVTIYKLASK